MSAQPTGVLSPQLLAASRCKQLFLFVFLESAATALIERGIFFYAKEELGFSDVQNLWLALVFAIPYVFAALGAHALTQRWMSERTMALLGVVGQAVFLLGVALYPVAWTIFVAQAVMGLCTGLKWPPVESYVSAGLTPSQASRRIGWFNVTWAGAVPIAVVVAGPLIDWWDRALFLLPPVLSLFSFMLMFRQTPRPIHLPDDHPERPTEEHVVRMHALLHASRWLLLGSYASYFVLAALMPGVFKDMKIAVGHATMLSAVIEVVRVITFFFMQRRPGWHFKVWPVVASICLVPIGFILIVSSGSLPAILIGEVLFGVAMGLTYYCALYYAMVVKNAAVDAGGIHEGLIGIGFVVGPIAGLIGSQAARIEGFGAWGIYVGVGPLMLISMGAGARAILPLLKRNDKA